MVVAGLEHAIELAELAMEETGFGVLEDKVVKNYIATEFLYDYLEDKRSVGVIDEDPERGIQYVAEPIGVVLALLPITNPTSTALFKAIVAAKTRNAMIFRPSARAARCATRRSRCCRRPARRPDCRPDALQVVPDPTLDASQYLFHHPGVDLIWTTGGPKAVAATNEAGKPCISVGPGQRAGLRAPQRRRRDGGRRRPDLQDLRRVGHLPGRADARRRRRDLRRLRRRARAHGRARARRRPRSTRSPRVAFDEDGRARMEALGHSCVDLAALAGIGADARQGARRAAARGPRRARRAPAAPREAHAGARRSCARRRSTTRIAACELVTEHGGLGHTSGIYATDEAVIERFAAAHPHRAHPRQRADGRRARWAASTTR